MTEALYLIAKTKKIKIELLTKKYLETIYTIDDTLYAMDARLRFSVKPENMSLKDMIPV